MKSAPNGGTPRPSRCAIIAGILLAVSAGLATLTHAHAQGEGGFGGGPADMTDECKHGWEFSSASRSCEAGSITFIVQDNKPYCRLGTLYCLDADGVNTYVGNIIVDPKSIASISNCSGVLKLGPCESTHDPRDEH